MPSTTRTRGAWPLVAVVAVVLAGLLAVPAPASAADRQVLAADAFGRTVTAGLGTADQGGAWSTSGAAGSYAVGGGRAALSPAPGQTLTAVLPSVSATDTGATATLVLPRLPAPGTSVYPGLVGRRVGSTTYQGRLVIGSTGSVMVQLMAGSATLATARLPWTVAPDVPLQLRVEVTGTGPTALRARTWPAASAEPTAWQVTATDSSSALQAPGPPGLVHYLSSAATGTLPVGFDDLVVTTTATAPPPNAPPTAAFTAATDGLTVTADAGPSTDADGTVVAWSWDLGDGTTSAGPTTTRTYAAAGTYRVQLTVTDDDGATASTTRDVTVTAPPPPPPPSATTAADSFGRSVPAGWGTADQGGAWSVSSSTGTAVDGARGRLTSTPGRTLTATLGAVSGTDTDAVLTLSVSQLPSSGSSYTSLLVRQGSAGGYAGRVVVASSGVATLYLNSGSTVLTWARLPWSVAAGDQVRLRVQATGTGPSTVRARAWPAAVAEPAAWTLTATDGTAGLQGPGAVAVSHYLSGGAAAAVTVSVDDLAVSGTTTSAPPPDPAPARPTQAQWLADVEQAMAGGLDFLDTQVGVAARPAIVLDVDNTALQSYYQPFAATPAVLQFAQRARADGFAVFVVTGRAPDTGGTADQLARAGYVVDGICFRDAAVTGQTSKENCRAARAAEGFTVVANVGNRDQDLTGANSGRTFKLPDYGFLD
ncbi:PKD domain-containing protein [Klenkia brasiliensis]|uniref:PKD domain-containing protein n=1 Tax=Klenkia brasiliensis TaxID=333142 RepID=A0A1G7V0Z1_9ACTN|nr:PKD domain-containing protein [Klenkia brasiliensis]SDG52620.1 PKD domain-containing protein [Klenkia brasiliensis]